MAEKSNAVIGFEKQIWDAACVLWGHIPAADYRKVIVGLIFLRYISNAFDKRYRELLAEGDGFEDDPDAYEEENIFFVPEEARWNEIASKAHTPEIGKVIDDAMRAIEKNNQKLKDVLPKITPVLTWISAYSATLWTCSPIWTWTARTKAATFSDALTNTVSRSSPRMRESRAASSTRPQAL